MTKKASPATKSASRPVKTTRKRKVAPAPGAAPVVPIDRTVVEGMVYAGGTIEEIAAFHGVSRDTIERRFRAQIEKSRARRKLRLRQLQWRAAENGDKAMLIWLGKQELGQQDTPTRLEHSGAGGAPLPAIVTVSWVPPST